MDQNGNKLATYTLTSACTLMGNEAPQCPAGWESVGYTQPGTCTIGNAPGEGHLNTYKMNGYNRVCKRRIPTSGDAAIDCCSNLFGIAGSLECRARGYTPYSWQCNTDMSNYCNTRVAASPEGPVWNGVPNGQTQTVLECNGKVRATPAAKQPGCLDEFCVNYLRNAPPDNFFHSHDFQDVGHHFPNYSYTTPAFSGSPFQASATWGYYPTRLSYLPYTDTQHKNNNNYCRQAPGECQTPTGLNNFHF